jgi:hypothetical protein
MQVNHKTDNQLSYYLNFNSDNPLSTTINKMAVSVHNSTIHGQGMIDLMKRKGWKAEGLVVEIAIREIRW